MKNKRPYSHVINIYTTFFPRVIIADMKVGKNPNRQNTRPANQIQFDEDGRGYTHERGVTAELDSVRRR